MSEKLGSVRYAGPRLQYIGGGAVNEDSRSSAETRETIDAEVRRIVGEQSARAEALLNLHRDALTRLAADLLQSLDGSAARDVLTRVVPAAGSACPVPIAVPPRPVPH